MPEAIGQPGPEPEDAHVEGPEGGELCTNARPQQDQDGAAAVLDLGPLHGPLEQSQLVAERGVLQHGLGAVFDRKVEDVDERGEVGYSHSLTIKGLDG